LNNNLILWEAVPFFGCLFDKNRCLRGSGRLYGKHSRRFGGGRRTSAGGKDQHSNEDKQHEETGPGFHFFLRA
jgi:hypothetical protein